MRPASSMVAGSLQRLCECECLGWEGGGGGALSSPLFEEIAWEPG